MRYIAPGTGFTNLQTYLGLNQSAAQQMGQRAVQGVQQAGAAAQGQLGTFQDQFQKMLASAQGQPAAPAAPGTTGGAAAPGPAATPGAAGGGGKSKPGLTPRGGPGISHGLIGQNAQEMVPRTIGREADLYGQYANTDLTKLTTGRLSEMDGWTKALSDAQQAAEWARQLGGGQGGLSALLGRQAGPGYYGGRGRAIDAYATANSGEDFDTASNAYKGIADAFGLADTASAAAVDKLKAGAAGWAALNPQQPGGAPAPAGPQPMSSPAPAGGGRRAVPVYSRDPLRYGAGAGARRRLA